jgi:hypothetical protein
MDEQNSGPLPLLDVIPAEQAGQRGVEVTVRKVAGGDIHTRRLPFNI